jgi:hypothetical protein
MLNIEKSLMYQERIIIIIIIKIIIIIANNSVASYPRNRPLKPCEMLRIPHCLENPLTDGGKVVSHTHWPRFTPRNIFWYSFLLESE